MPQEIDADLADALKMTSPHGVLIAEITKDSPADKAGLQIEDVVIRLNGQEITSSRKLIAVAERLTIGESYPIVILRDGQEKELKLTVGEFPEKLLAEKSDAEAEGQSSGAAASSGLLIEELGVEVEPMTPEIAEQLNLPQPTGVVVTSVRRGGLGQTLGISAGTAILKIGSTKISSVDDVKVAVAEAKKQGQVLMFLKTANGNQFIS
ncbi:MAG: PDZ domain-containing protein, partial [Phycisphaerae bacterium]